MSKSPFHGDFGDVLGALEHSPLGTPDIVKPHDVEDAAVDAEDGTPVGSAAADDDATASGAAGARPS